MRRIVLLLLLVLSLTLLPLRLQAWDDEPYKEAERLALQERYEEAVARMQQFDLPNDSYKWVQSKIGLCVTYSLWGKNAEALDACVQPLDNRFFKDSRKCISDAITRRIRVIDTECSPTAARYDLVLYLNIWQILAYKRSNQLLEALGPLIIAQLLFNDLGEEKLFFDAVNAFLWDDFKRLEADYQQAGRDTAKLEHLRIVFTYGGASTPAARAMRTARMLWAEQPYAKPAVYTFAAVLLCATLYTTARRPLNILAMGTLSAAKATPGRVNAWLHPVRTARPAPSAAPTPPAAPVYAPAPVSPPPYFNYRYPNQAYRIAGYCFAAFWIVLLGPLVVALLLPAFTLLADFSTKGFQNAYSHFLRILTASLTWARLWFALLLFSLIGFIGFKLYGRFSLPKRMRPPIRVVYGTLRFAFLGAILTAVGTFLSYFTAAFTGLYSNPLVRMLINLIRNLLGF